MIYELRTYQLRPGTVPAYLDYFAEAGLSIITRYAELVGYFYTETGALNRIVHLWRYRDRQHRAEQRAKLIADPQWRYGFLAYAMGQLLDQHSQLLQPLPFSRDPLEPLPPAAGLRLFEIQRKTIATPDRAAYLEYARSVGPTIESHVDRRAAFSADSGDLGELVELFSFADEADRVARRAGLSAALTATLGKAPPVPLRVEQQTLVSAPFSPLR